MIREDIATLLQEYYGDKKEYLLADQIIKLIVDKLTVMLDREIEKAKKSPMYKDIHYTENIVAQAQLQHDIDTIKGVKE